MMLYVFSGLLVFLVIVLVTVSARNDDRIKALLSSSLFLGMLIVLMFLIVPNELGYGYVSWKKQDFLDRLSMGTKYHLLYSVKDGNTDILVIQRQGTSEFFALRVKEQTGKVPEYFTLIDGKPAEISP